MTRGFNFIVRRNNSWKIRLFKNSLKRPYREKNFGYQKCLFYRYDAIILIILQMGIKRIYDFLQYYLMIVLGPFQLVINTHLIVFYRLKCNMWTHHGGIPPMNTSELEGNFPKSNSFPLDVLVCVIPSTPRDVCSSLRDTCKQGNNKTQVEKCLPTTSFTVTYD